MNMKIRIALATLAAATFGGLLLVAGGTAGPPSEISVSGLRAAPSYERLDEREYESVRIRGPKPRPKEISLGFTRGEPLSGPEDPETEPLLLYSGGCNSWASNYSIRRGRIKKYGDSFGTAVGCFPDHDSWISSRLSKGMRIKLHGRTLTLRRGKAFVKLRETRP